MTSMWAETFNEFSTYKNPFYEQWQEKMKQNWEIQKKQGKRK